MNMYKIMIRLMKFKPIIYTWESTSTIIIWMCPGNKSTFSLYWTLNIPSHPQCAYQFEPVSSKKNCEFKRKLVELFFSGNLFLERILVLVHPHTSISHWVHIICLGVSVVSNIIKSFGWLKDLGDFKSST